MAYYPAVDNDIDEGRHPHRQPTPALKGLRIIDLGWAMAGPQATRLMADFGAEVIKVESMARPDLARVGFGPHIGDPAIENSAYFNNFNRNKLSAAINMQTEKGREIFAQLVAISDAVLENFSAGVMKRWGFDYEGLCSIRPDIVYVSMAGLGQVGPYASYQTFGPQVQALSGMVHITGLPDRGPSAWGYSYMDHTGGYYGAMALMAALLHRRRTGQGQHIDLSQTEAAITLTGPSLLDYTVNGRASTRNGNRHAGMAPHGIYRCAEEPDKPVGDDQWVAIACETEPQWQALCSVMGHSEWRDDARFCTLASREAHQDELDRMIEAWTRGRTKNEAMALLQAAGVPAGAVQRSLEMLDSDPQLAHLGLYPKAQHHLLGEHRIDGMPVRMSRTQPGYTTGAPRLGRHNAYVFGELLGIDEDEIARLESEKVLW
jgi:crotonobetainyl-CoA:carnitine CoA-transferase CaiB-like acyl-CoA transferase